MYVLVRVHRQWPTHMYSSVQVKMLIRGYKRERMNEHVHLQDGVHSHE